MANFTLPILLLLLLQTLTLTLASSAHPAYDSATSCDLSAAAAAAGLRPERREEYDGGRILDITHFYHPDMPTWESDEGVGQFLWLPKSMKNGSLANNSEMKLPTHTGTHVDAPGHVFQHYFDAGFDVDTLDLHVLNVSRPCLELGSLVKVMILDIANCNLTGAILFARERPLEP